ncbi:glycosyltransferase family protein [Mesorhizobium sp. ZMM04-5]|uniref:Glycosyltransferase family protein n=1 Tax=Mesorhizobium marinum TaxID=3228790 RepID=A0ABV3R034_9HYPH
MKRVTILVTHLLGTGHLSRSMTLARSLRDAGFAPLVISGGMPTSHLDLSGLDFVQLPPVRSDGASFTRLLDTAGEPVSPEFMQERIEALEDALRQSPPDVLITELFPFGRRVLRQEFEAALSLTGSLDPAPLVLCSIRDILAPPSSEKKAKQTEAWLAQYYDGVLVHSDIDVVPLQASWPVTPAIERLLHYTGFIAPPLPAIEPAAGEGLGEIVVTAGGGPVGRRLFDTAIEAARLGERRWRLLVGGGDAAEVCARLNAAAAGAPAFAEPLRADYRSMLTRCAAAVGQCGYNTAIDWLQAGVPGVFVPFAEAGEVEQTLRAASLRQRYGYGCIAEDELTPQNLADAADAAVRHGRVSVNGLKFGGAAQTARILDELLRARR